MNFMKSLKMRDKNEENRWDCLTEVIHREIKMIA